MAWTAVDQEQETTDNRENLEEVVLGEVLVGVVFVELGRLLVQAQHNARTVGTYGPEVVGQDVENAEDQNQQGSTELGLEANDNHDARNKAKKRHNHTPEAPLSSEDEADEEEDEEHATGQLEVHLPVLLVELRQSGKSCCLPYPGVRQDHQESTHDREVSKEEVEVKDETVTESLSDHNTD